MDVSIMSVPSGIAGTVVSALATLVAAFAGAGFAFYLAARHRVRDLENGRVATGNRAIFALLRQFNVLHNLRTQIVDPKREDPLRLVNMRALSEQKYDGLHVDLDALTFLLETEEREVLGRLMVADDCFHSAIQALNERSTFHRETIQPIIRAKDVKEGCATTLEHVEELLGHAIFVELQRATDQAISLIDRTLVLTQKTADQFRAALKKRFPRRILIQFVPIDDPTEIDLRR